MQLFLVVPIFGESSPNSVNRPRISAVFVASAVDLRLQVRCEHSVLRFYMPPSRSDGCSQKVGTAQCNRAQGFFKFVADMGWTSQWRGLYLFALELHKMDTAECTRVMILFPTEYSEFMTFYGTREFSIFVWEIGRFLKRAKGSDELLPPLMRRCLTHFLVVQWIA